MAQHDFVFVYGAGISGQGVSQVLLDQGEKVILYNDEQKDLEQTFREDMKKRGGKIVFSEDPRPYLKKSKLFIISPGIPFTTDVVKKPARRNSKSLVKQNMQAASIKATGWALRERTARRQQRPLFLGCLQRCRFRRRLPATSAMPFPRNWNTWDRNPMWRLNCQVSSSRE